MSVSAVQNYDKKNPLSTVIASTTIGGVVGYGAKYAIPLTKNEFKDINRRAIVNTSRKDINLHKVNAFKVQKTRTDAQDAFVKVIDNKEYFKNPTPRTVAERLGGEETEFGKKILSVINKDANKNLNADGVLIELGKETETAKKILEITSKEENKGIGFKRIIEKLGEMTPEGKELQAIVQKKANKNLDIEGAIKELGKNTPVGKEFHRVSNLTNVFANDNLKFIVGKLGGEESSAGKEFRRIVKEVDQEASTVSRKILAACKKVVKDKRYTAPLIIAGAAAGFATAFVHNVLSTKTEA